MLHASTINPKMVQGLQGWIFLEEMKLRKMLQTCLKRQQVSCYGSTLFFFRRRTKHKWLCWCEVSETSTCEFVDAAGLYPIVGVVGFVLFIMAEARSRFFARSFQFFTISFSRFFCFQSRHFFLEFSRKFLLFLSVLSAWFVLCCIFCSSVKGIGVQLRVLLALQWVTYSPRASVDKSIIQFCIKQFMYSFAFWNFVSIDYRSIMLYFITGCPRGRPRGTHMFWLLRGDNFGHRRLQLRPKWRDAHVLRDDRTPQWDCKKDNHRATPRRLLRFCLFHRCMGRWLEMARQGVNLGGIFIRENK
jgi:hypothetical protein